MQVMKTQSEENASSALSQHRLRQGSVVPARTRGLRIALPFALAVGLCASAALAWDDNDDHQGGGTVKLLTTVPIPVVKTNTEGAMKTFDISWVDANTRRYFLADRSNQAIDVIDTRTNKVVDQIPANNPPFAGASGDNDTSGPNGVVVFGHWLFASDFNTSSKSGRVVTIDLNTGNTVADFSTGGTARADEMAFDPHDGLLLAVNNADSPPFATLIKVDPDTGALSFNKKIVFAGAPAGAFPAGVNATNGAEQPVWEPGTGRFYISIPEINGPGNCPPACGPLGAVARINPSSGAVEVLFPVKNCQPAGLTVGPKQDLLVGCSVAFDTAGNTWVLANPLSPNPPNPSAVTAAPVSIIMDAKNGSIDKTVKGVSGNDEVWFNSGDGRYYLAARNQPGGPVLGVIDAKSQKLLQLVPTVNQASVPTASKQPGSAHSVAADSHNNHVFVPLPTNNVFPNCLTGCVAVFGVPKQEKHDD
jgi:hypothetical protein